MLLLGENEMVVEKSVEIKIQSIRSSSEEAVHDFICGGQRWEFYLSPDKNNKDFFSAYVELGDYREQKVKASIHFTIANDKGNSLNSQEEFNWVLMKGHQRWRFTNLIDGKTFENSSGVNVILLVRVVVSSICNSWRVYVPQSNIRVNIFEVLHDQLRPDITFKFKLSGEVIGAHKVILTSRSSVFRVKFFDGTKLRNSNEKEEVIIYNIEPSIFLAMLNYIYFDFIWVEPSPSYGNEKKLLHHAEACGLEGFQEQFQAYLFDKITVNSAGDIYGFADGHDLIGLKSACLEFVSSNLESVLMANGFRKLQDKYSSFYSEARKIEPKLNEVETTLTSWYVHSTYTLGLIYEEQIGCDVFFEVGDKKIGAHKIVLAARSLVLRELLYEKGVEIVNEPELLPDDLEALLKFLYVDELVESNSLSYSDIFVAAERYGLERLGLICQARLCSGLSVDSVAELYELATKHNAKQLKSTCLKYAGENIKDILLSNGYLYLKEKNLALHSEIERMSSSGIGDE